MATPGPFEFLIVIAIGLVVIGVPVAIIVLAIILFTRRQGPTDLPADARTVARLIEENQELRKEVAELRSRPSQREH